MPSKPTNRDPNIRLITARKARGLKVLHCVRGLEEFAQAHLGERYRTWVCPPDRYRGWEAGREPQSDAWPVLTGYFAATPAELGLVAGWPCTTPLTVPTVDTTPIPTVVQEFPSQRRTVLAGGLGLMIPLSPTPTRVEMRHVRELDTGTSRLRASDQLHGGRDLISTAETLLEHGRALISVGSYSDHVSRRLYSAVGGVAVQTGWLCMDGGDHARAQTHFKEGLLAATVSRDDPVAVHALATLGLQAEETGQFRESLSYIQAALDVAGRWAHPALRALLLSREAAQRASLGDLTRAHELAGQAHDMFESPPEDTWFSFVDQGELFVTEGCGLLAGGDARHGTTVLARAVADTSPLRRRNAISRSLHLANARLAAGDPNGAVEQAELVVDQVADLGSARVRGSVRRLRAALMAKHRRLRAVTRFEERSRMFA